jgi:hypothetical protein
MEWVFCISCVWQKVEQIKSTTKNVNKQSRFLRPDNHSKKYEGQEGHQINSFFSSAGG